MELVIPAGRVPTSNIDLGKPKSVASVIYFDVVNIDYVIESATYRFLFTSCKTLENERVSAANE